MAVAYPEKLNSKYVMTVKRDVYFIRSEFLSTCIELSLLWLTWDRSSVSPCRPPHFMYKFESLKFSRTIENV